MKISNLNRNILTNTAIAALKNTYEECSDNAAKESIITAFKAIIQLQHEIEINKNLDNMSESEGSYDDIEYCAAV